MDSIQKLADEFEDEWFVGNRPDLRDFLGRVDKEQRDELLNLLLPIDVEYRRKANDDVKAMDYDDLGSAGIEMVGSLLAPSQNDSSTADADNQIGQQIGDYRLIELIGEGGMGAVYRAVQNQHVRREVALKIIKSGLDSKEVIVRFEAERQAVAMMDHPNIARVLDAGTTDLGQPYFAMELVRGIPLTTYCDVHQLGIRDRLGLFIQICRGVQHAHQKGIIHILVAEYNGQPVPKVIDFGLAKALDTEQRLTDKSVFTEFGQVLGTLKYMSPEQAGLDSLDIDTRSDIYALGVILYELLTGQTPLDDDSIVNDQKRIA
jgi:serine/threonine protein kinase